MLAEEARKADEDRKKAEEEECVWMTAEESGSNRIDVDMTTESECVCGVECVLYQVPGYYCL